MTEQAVRFLGYGSLMSKASAEQTFGPLPAFRVVRVHGYARIFNKVCVHSIMSGVASAGSCEIACACAVELADAELTAVVIDIPADRTAGFFAREREYKIVEAEYTDIENKEAGSALLCTMWNDEELHRSFDSDNKDFEQSVGQYYSGKMWRKDILPARAYLGCCVASAKTLGILAQFLDETLLADGSSLRAFLDSNPDYLDVSEDETPGRYRISDET